MYADKHGMSTICMRIGSFQPRPLNVRMLSCWISHQDMVQLARVCLDAPPAVHYEVVWGVSGNDRSWWDNTPAERLGYCPRDNSEDFAEEIFAAQRRAREQSQAASKSSTTDVADQAAVVSAIKAVQADEPPAEGLFQGGPFCAMEFTGDLDKID
jgi:uronate dehydrogenase